MTQTSTAVLIPTPFSVLECGCAALKPSRPNSSPALIGPGANNAALIRPGAEQRSALIRPGAEQRSALIRPGAENTGLTAGAYNAAPSSAWSITTSASSDLEQNNAAPSSDLEQNNAAPSSDLEQNNAAPSSDLERTTQRPHQPGAEQRSALINLEQNTRALISLSRNAPQCRPAISLEQNNHASSVWRRKRSALIRPGAEQQEKCMRF
ncbi:hypothetical protein WMY93_008359 [Mugilogobius chulae]|uniref:Uncharacterized protein n=1 Tax=Mugilogobius chulae TaxID=88201 RepID=A0AAW0PM61_9GOBI